MPTPTRLTRRAASAALSTLVAAGAAIGISFVDPPPVAACSCIQFDSIERYANANSAIFTGTAGRLHARGVPIEVDQWFWGPNAAPVVWLAARSFGDSAACGATRPTAGARWLFVGHRERPADDLTTSLCSPSADLATPDGQARLADARRAFAGIEPPTSEPSLEAPIPRASPDAVPPASASPQDDLRARALAGAGAPILLLVLVLFGGLILLARRRPAGR